MPAITSKHIGTYMHAEMRMQLVVAGSMQTLFDRRGFEELILLSCLVSSETVDSQGRDMASDMVDALNPASL